MKTRLGLALITALTMTLALAVSAAFAQAPVTVQLSAAGNSGVTGTATLTASENQTMVTVNLQGMQPNSAHAGHIHTGTCTNQGPVQFPLETATADASGNAMTETTINATLASLMDGNHYVQYHVAETPPGAPISCGDIAQSTGGSGATAAPTALPRSGGLPLLPLLLAGASALGLGVSLRRR